MKNEKTDKIVFLTLIAGRKQKDAILSELSELGVKLANTMYGKGTVNAGYWENILGFITEENKVMITCVSSYDKCNAVLSMLIEKFNFDKPNTGIAFTMLVDRLSF